HDHEVAAEVQGEVALGGRSGDGGGGVEGGVGGVGTVGQAALEAHELVGVSDLDALAVVRIEEAGDLAAVHGQLLLAVDAALAEERHDELTPHDAEAALEGVLAPGL